MRLDHSSKVFLWLQWLASGLVITLSLAWNTQSLAYCAPGAVCQPLPELSLQRFRPAPNPSDFLTIYSTAVGRHLEITGGMYLHFSSSPLTLQTTEGKYADLLSYQMASDLFVSIPLYNWVDVGIVTPLLIAQQVGGQYDEFFDDKPAPSGLGDTRLSVKSKILTLGEYPIGLAGVIVLSLPTAFNSNLYSDQGMGFETRMLLDVIPYGGIRMAFNLGYRYRPDLPLIRGKYMLGDSIIIGGAATVPLFVKDLDLLLEANGEITVDPDNEVLSPKERPVEFEMGLRYRLWQNPYRREVISATFALGLGSSAISSPDVRAIVGIGYHWVEGGSWSSDYDYGGYLKGIAECPDPKTTPLSQIPLRCRGSAQTHDADGDGIPDKDDDCPLEGVKGKVDAHGCLIKDRDGDGIPDHLDKCPDEPEDEDHFKEYKDGCPEDDYDKDTIPDNVDQCPTYQEIFNGVDDEDGCPDDDPNANVRVHNGQVQILKQVYFESGKAVIKKESYEVLDEVAKLLKKNPQIGLIEIEGHTDDVGNPDKNKILSQKRADSVRDYLISKGVSPDRIKAVGYGEERPAVPIDGLKGEALKKARQKNRRVVFTIHEHVKGVNP